MMYVALREFFEAQDTEGYKMTLRRLISLANATAHRVYAEAYADPATAERKGVLDELTGAGFDKLVLTGHQQVRLALPRDDDDEESRPRKERYRISGTGVRLEAQILRDARTFRPDTVIIVSADNKLLETIGGLRQEGIQVVVFNPHSYGSLHRYADASCFLGDVCRDSDPFPDFMDERGETLLAYDPDMRRPETRILDNLQRRDPEMYGQVHDILTARPETVLQTLTSARARHEMHLLPERVIALFLILNDLRSGTGDDRILRWNDVCRRMLDLNIDIRTTGEEALDILCEEGTLQRFGEGRSASYLFTRSYDDPTHILARKFCAKTVRVATTDARPTDSYVDTFLENTLDALTTLSTNPVEIDTVLRERIETLLLIYGHTDEIEDFTSTDAATRRISWRALLTDNMDDVRTTFHRMGVTDAVSIERFLADANGLIREIVGPDAEAPTDPEPASTRSPRPSASPDTARAAGA